MNLRLHDTMPFSYQVAIACAVFLIFAAWAVI